LEQPRWHQSGLLRRIGSTLGIELGASRDRYQRYLLERIARTKFDYVFVIKGELLSERFISELKIRNDGAKFILYQWDSMARVPDIRRILPYFDRVLSFDRRDCLEHSGIIFRPLFYRDATISQARPSPIAYDLTFIGWLHSDRFGRLLEIENELSARGLRVYFYLYTGVGTYLRYFVRGKHKLLHFRKLPFDQVTKIVGASKCVLDLPHPDQNGLTIRSIEAVGMRRKLVTTNSDIVNYDFFDRRNILAAEKLDFAEIASFIESGPGFVPEEVLRGYTLDNWLITVFGLSSASEWQMQPRF